jgi:hypothetical protein
MRLSLFLFLYLRICRQIGGTIGEIEGSHGGYHEYNSLLGCCAVWSCGRSLPMFQRCYPHPSLGLCNEKVIKCVYILH